MVSHHVMEVFTSEMKGSHLETEVSASEMEVLTSEMEVSHLEMKVFTSVMEVSHFETEVFTSETEVSWSVKVLFTCEKQVSNRVMPVFNVETRPLPQAVRTSSLSQTRSLPKAVLHPSDLIPLNGLPAPAGGTDFFHPSSLILHPSAFPKPHPFEHAGEAQVAAERIKARPDLEQ